MFWSESLLSLFHLILKRHKTKRTPLPPIGTTVVYNNNNSMIEIAMKLVVSQTTIDDAHENMTAIALSICQKHWNKYMTECTMGQKKRDSKQNAKSKPVLSWHFDKIKSSASVIKQNQFDFSFSLSRAWSSAFIINQWGTLFLYI